MARPRYRPGSTHSFEVKRNRGVRKMGPYLASRLLINDRRALYLLDQGEVKLNGVRVGLDDEVDVFSGSVVTVRFPDEWPPYLKPTEMELDIIYEDDCMVVLNKPAGIVVHPARGHLSGNTIQNGLIHRYRDDTNPDKSVAPPHRLDKDTSGVLVFSRTREAYRSLTAQFSTPEPKKTYLAITEGEAQWDSIIVDQPLGDDPEWPSRGTVLPVEEGGKESITEFTCLERIGGCSIIQARPITGRGHQIRLHLKYLNLPIISDLDYNKEGKTFEPINRQALHASSLSLKHPLTDEPLEFEAPLLADMKELMAALRS